MTVVVAGGTRGIGLELASALGANDGRVVVGYGHDDDAARRAEERLSVEGLAVKAVKVDMRDPEGARELVEAVGESTITQLVHSCAQLGPGRLLGGDDRSWESEWSASLAVNAISLVWLARAAESRLRAGSSLLYVTSTGAKRALADYASLGPAKNLGEGLMRYLAVELAPLGVRANALAPGIQDTKSLRRAFGKGAAAKLSDFESRNPSGRLVRPDDYTSVALFLASSDAKMVTGQVLNVYGGMDLL